MNIFFMSLGCDKNLVDSEMMISRLQDYDFQLVSDPEDAEVIVINTCCFISDAKEESINSIIEMGEYKEGNCKLLVVCGCLAQRYHKEILEELPEVDIIIGATAVEKLSEAILKTLDNKGEIEKSTYLEDVNYLPKSVVYDDHSSGGSRAYLKIAEGCDKCCTYCVIPEIKGHYRSVPMPELLLQATHLVENGARELILVAQETTLYGTDIYGEKKLHVLLNKLSNIEGLKWIRLLYCYPEEIYDELIYEIRDNKKVCHYIDMPIQHASDNILSRMGRWTNKQELVDIVGKLKDNIPDIAIRTTLITGFPGETEDDFDEMYEFVREMNFKRLGVFTYSQEENTPAAEFENQIDEDVKADRRDRIMELQQSLAFDEAQAQVGRELDVMIEGFIPEDNIYVGRSYMDAPDVDGLVFVNYDGRLDSGDFVRVEIIQAKDYDLVGEVL